MTGKTKSETTLAFHHLYNRSTYPELAADQDNLFVITEEVHKDFHGWHEGTIKPCTVNDFIRFIENRKKYENRHLVLAKLDDRKRSLEQKLKTRAKFLLLPASDNNSTIVSTNTFIDRSFLGKECFAMINSEKQQGKILAIAHHHDRCDICFQVNSEGMGIWISVSNLVNE